MKSKWVMMAVVFVLILSVTACSAGPVTTPAASTSAPSSAPPSSVEAEVAISGFAFDPPSLTVKVGTTVKWTNQDSAPHTVASDGGDWESGQLDQGESFTHTFDQAGTFAYHCSVHPAMKGTVVVTQ